MHRRHGDEPLELLADDLRRHGHRVGTLRAVSSGDSVVATDGKTVVRVDVAGVDAAESTIATALTLSALRVPVLAPAVAVPVRTRFGIVTLWPHASASTSPGRHLGEALAQLHRTPVSVIGRRLSTRDRLWPLLGTLEQHGVPAATCRQLRRLADDLSPVPSWQQRAGVVVHGDAHPGNVMVAARRPVLIDLATVHVGPAQLDLIPVWCAARRGAHGWTTWHDLRAGYHSVDDRLDLTGGLWNWEHLDEASLERELLTTLFLARQWRRHPWVRSEIFTRLRSWGDPDHGDRWNTGS